MTIKNTHKLIDYDFSTLATSVSDKKTYQRLMILAYLKEGKSQAEVGRLLYISAQKVAVWLKRFNEGGIDNLQDKVRSGRPPPVSG